MDPMTMQAIITTGGGLLDTILGAIGAGMDDTAEKDREAQLKIAADSLGLNYANLKQQADQFRVSQRNELKKWADTKGINLAQLAEQIRSNKAGEAFQKETLETSKQQFAINRGDDPALAREKRKNALRKQFLGSSVPTAPAVPTPTSKTVVPTANTANKNLGAEALAAPATKEQGVA